MVLVDFCTTSTSFSQRVSELAQNILRKKKLWEKLIGGTVELGYIKHGIKRIPAISNSFSFSFDLICLKNVRI